MERLTHERVNGIKTGYWSAATKEVLVQKLAAYENTGYEPDEIRAAIEQAAKNSETKTATIMAECIAGAMKDTLEKNGRRQRERSNHMNEQNQRDSIMSMARGAFEERVDYEMDKVIQNILDPNTKATAKRKITLTIELTPDDERRTIGVQVTAKSTLAATNPVATALYVTSDGNGELVVAEMVPQVPGQMNMDGTQQEAPKLLKLVQHG